MIKHEEEEVLSEELHTKYQAGIGKLQHLVQNSQPDIGNAVRQLVRPTKTHYNAMLSPITM